jgi:drug/metabolite transporter (DMT)-like permease
MALEGVVIPAWMCAHARADTVRLLRPYAALGLIGAALSVTAYALVLWAQTRAELAPIAALRESSIIVGAAIGAVFFKERFGAPRLAAAGLLVVGIGLMMHAG